MRLAASMRTRGLYSKPTTTDPAPKLNRLISVLFVAGSLGFLVNAVVFEPKRCTPVESLNYGKQPIAQCGSMLSTFSCTRLDGSGSDPFDGTNCAGGVCTPPTTLETVTVKCSDCEAAGFLGGANLIQMELPRPTGESQKLWAVMACPTGYDSTCARVSHGSRARHAARTAHARDSTTPRASSAPASSKAWEGHLATSRPTLASAGLLTFS